MEEQVQEIEIPVITYKVYARPNSKNQVERFFSTCFEEPQDGDVLLNEGTGDEYVHVGYLEAYDDEGLHNYKVASGEVVECASEDKQQELSSRPAPQPTAEEQILQLQAVVIELQYQNRLKEMEMLG